MKKRLVCLASLLLLLAVWAQSAAAEETAWRTQRYDLVGAEFSVVPPDGSYLLNENTRELLRNDREAADALMRLQGEDSIDRLCANGGNMVLDLEGYLRMLVEISSTDMDQSVLWMYEDAFCSAVGDEMENNGYTDIEFDWYMSPAGNQFFCAYGQGTSLGQTRTYSHIATADNNGHLVEIWTYGMERADIERVLDNIAAPVNQSADERTVSDAFRKNLLQSELFVWDDCLLFTENGQSVSIYGLSMGYDMPRGGS